MVFLFMFATSSCSKNGNKRYPYLNDVLNDNAKITNAELRAINFENYASSATALGVNTKSDPSLHLSLSRASIRLDGGSIHMLIDVDVWEPNAQLWMEHSSKEDRMHDCERVGYMAAQELAKQLECDPSLITVEIQSKTGQLNIRELRVNKKAEQTAPSNR
jgi:hypothetical protein